MEWIARQPWCNGNIGMIGYPYYGMTQLMTAAPQPPRLKTIFGSHVGADFYWAGSTEVLCSHRFVRHTLDRQIYDVAPSGKGTGLAW